ncbi:MAG: hypothetical protein ABI432_16305 [Flavobacteriales bacterium]
MPRTHLLICACLVILILPIWWWDNHTLKSSGRDWIALDFRGLFVKSYLVFLLLHIALSTAAMRYFAGSHPALIHLCSAVCAIALLAAGLFVYGRVQESTAQRATEELLEQRKAHLHDIELKSWRYVPDGAYPERIEVDLRVAVAGRFSGSMIGAEGEEQRTVKTGEQFTYAFKLNSPDTIPGTEIEFTFFLFKGPVGTATPEDVAKVFKRTFTTDDDGSYFFGILPPYARTVQ